MYIIAELGANYGDLEHCKEAVNLAKSIGANAIKFQYFNSQDLYGFGYGKSLMSLEWLSILSSRAKNFGIDFLCSAFSPECYQDIDPYVKIHKVASSESTHVRILQKLRRLGKPVILSVGATPMLEIGLAMNILQDFELPIDTVNKFRLKTFEQPDFPPLKEVTIMHCVSAYPAKNPNLARITELKKWFPNNPIGFSDHTIDIATVPRMAQSLGVEVYEKHFTNERVMSLDSGHSLIVNEFKDMVESLKDPNYIPLDTNEKEMYMKHNRRLIATKPIERGEIFKEGYNFGIFRSEYSESKAFSPYFIGLVEGGYAMTDLKQGEGIGPNDIRTTQPKTK